MSAPFAVMRERCLAAARLRVNSTTSILVGRRGGRGGPARSFSAASSKKDEQQKTTKDGGQEDDEGGLAWAAGFLAVIVLVPGIIVTRDYWSLSTGDSTKKSSSWF